MGKAFTTDDVKHIAKLANIPVTEAEAAKLSEEFSTTIVVVDKLQKLDVTDVPAIHMTGLSNVLRDDVVDETRMFSQKQALANAKLTHDGYFVVDQIIEQDD